MGQSVTMGNAAGQTIEAGVERTPLQPGDTVTILVDRVVVGTARWSGHRLEDCAARLGADQDETDDLYSSLDLALAREMAYGEHTAACAISSWRARSVGPDRYREVCPECTCWRAAEVSR